MENINLADLKLSQEELIDIIKFLAKKRNIKNYKRKWSNELLQAIKQNKINKQQSKIKERIDNIREDLKNLNYKLSKSELKEIKKNLYNIEKIKFTSKRTNKYLDELYKKYLN